MAETKRCPNCGGLNPVAAEWCGQCLTRFSSSAAQVQPVPPGPPPPPVAGAPAEPPALVDQGVAQVETGTAIGTRRGAFTVREAGVVWACPRCDTENPLDHPVCSVCGTSFGEVMHPKPERPQRDPGTAALLSLFLPGAGHAYLGMWGQGIARAILSVWVVFVSLVALFTGEGETGPQVIAIVFGAAATGLWGVAAHDAYREAGDQSGQVLLKGRGFLYVVVALLMLLLILLTITSIRPPQS